MKYEKYIKDFAERFNLSIEEYNQRKYIIDEAVDLGAVRTLCLMSKTGEAIIDFAFDNGGKCLGYFTECKDSFVKINEEE